MARIFRSIFKNLFFMGKRILFFAKDPEADIEQSGIKKGKKPSGKEIKDVREKIAKDFEKRVEHIEPGIKLEPAPEYKVAARPRSIPGRIIEFLINGLRRAGQHLVRMVVLSTLKIHIINKDNIPDIPKALIVANHASYLDVLVLGVALFSKGLKTRWVISKSNYDIWCLKWLYFLFPVIVADGGCVEKIRRALDEDMWVVIFPEGNQKWCPPNKDKGKKPGRGVAVAALSTGVPVLPIRIIGADKVLPAQSFKLDRKHTITVRIGKPFSYAKRNDSSIDEDLLLKTRQEIMNKIYEIASLSQK